MALRSVGCVPVGPEGALFLSDPRGPGRFGAEARARVESPCDHGGDRRQYMRAALRDQDGQFWVRPARSQGSHIISAMLNANSFVVLEPRQRAEIGDEVLVQVVGELVMR